MNHLDEKTGSRDAGERLMTEIRRVARLLAANPMMGRPRSDIRDVLRSYVAGSFTLFYRV